MSNLTYVKKSSLHLPVVPTHPPLPSLTEHKISLVESHQCFLRNGERKWRPRSADPESRDENLLASICRYAPRGLESSTAGAAWTRDDSFLVSDSIPGPDLDLDRVPEPNFCFDTSRRRLKKKGLLIQHIVTDRKVFAGCRVAGGDIEANRSHEQGRERRGSVAHHI
ncbi:hypothetical protein EVAR_78430_1 [Eumeta japonica]|uniref:Uncharacterized protein n=1 Tax=Eumeta variegata TaxID=151549 RepID=A0A4C1TY29_EUMVA|nr:hypothetical protein EVAR_78430_1 [Eumeta japonica]